LAAAVYEFTAGHPLSVAMVAALHQSLPPEQRSAAAFDKLLAALPPGEADAHAELAIRIIAGARVEGLDRVIEACAVAGVFDVEMLGALIGDDVAVTPRRLIELLRRQTFVEEVTAR